MIMMSFTTKFISFCQFSAVFWKKPCPLLLFFSTPLLLPACHKVNRFLASFLVVIFPLSNRILYRVDGAEIKDLTATASSFNDLALQ